MIESNWTESNQQVDIVSAQLSCQQQYIPYQNKWNRFSIMKSFRNFGFSEQIRSANFGPLKMGEEISNPFIVVLWKILGPLNAIEAKIFRPLNFSGFFQTP